MTRRGYAGDPMVAFDALEFIKLARPESSDATFTFAHRRFQEYFATSVVLEEPDAVPPERLLTDARWRETAVVLLQTRTGERLEQIVVTIGDLLEREVAAIEGALPEEPGVREFPWPALALHLLSLLQSAYQGRANAAPERLRELAGRIVHLATETGTLADRKWALEVAGIAPEPILMQAIRKAFTGPSVWLAEVAYRQVALLGSVPPDIARAIRDELLDAFAAGRLRRERHATLAHLHRLPQHEQFVQPARLLLIVAPVDVILHVLIFASALALDASSPTARELATLLALNAALPYLPAWLSARNGTATRNGTTTAWGGFVAMIFLMRFMSLVMLPTLVPGSALAMGLWGVGAIGAATTGHFTATGWWPLLSFFPILITFRDDNVLPRAGQIGLLSVGGTTLATGGVLLVVIVAGSSLSSITDTAGPVFCGLFALLLLAAFWQIFAGRIRDHLLWSRKVRHEQRFNDAGELAARLHMFRTPQGKVRFLEWVTHESRLDPTAENAASMRKLAIDFERDAGAAGVVDALNILAEQLRARGTPTMPADETLVR